MRTTQTLCSQLIPKAVERLGNYILLGPMNAQVLSKYFTQVGCENTLRGLPCPRL
jgi:hypothetical protein